MTVIMLEVVALIFQRMERLMFDLPPGPTTPHEGHNGTLVDPQVCHPAEVLDLVSADLPVLNTIDSHVRIRFMERDLIDQPKPVDQTCGAVVPCIISGVPSLLSRLHLLEQKSLIAFFDPENRVQMVVLQGLDVGCICTQTVFGDNELEMRVVLAQLGHKPFGGMPFAIVLGGALVFHNLFGHQGDHFTNIRMDDRRAQQLMRIGDRPVPVELA